MSRTLAAVLAVLAVFVPQQSWAWGPVGHSTVALIARSYLTPRAQARVEEILAADPDTLTGRSMADRANWADAWRTTHPETFNWHFIDTEIDDGDMNAACYGFPAQGPWPRPARLTIASSTRSTRSRANWAIRRPRTQSGCWR